LRKILRPPHEDDEAENQIVLKKYLRSAFTPGRSRGKAICQTRFQAQVWVFIPNHNIKPPIFQIYL
jgi:hypothetical protein